MTTVARSPSSHRLSPVAPLGFPHPLVEPRLPSLRPPSRSPAPHPTTCTLHSHLQLALALAWTCTLLAHSSLDEPSFSSSVVLSTLNFFASPRDQKRSITPLIPPHSRPSLRSISHGLHCLPIIWQSPEPAVVGLFAASAPCSCGAFRRWFALIFAPFPFSLLSAAPCDSTLGAPYPWISEPNQHRPQSSAIVTMGLP